MKKINYTELGGTLFVPSTHKSIEDIVCKGKYPELRSVLIDTEDGIEESDLPLGLINIEKLLKNKIDDSLFLFIRPRNTETLKKILKLKGVEKVDGFILPKFSLENAREYLDILDSSNFYIMPSIEGKELFEQSKLIELRDVLMGYMEKIILVRFGLEDMLKELGMRRSCEDSIFDFSSSSFVLGSFIAVFKSSGFAISGGVYPCFNDKDGFARDVKRDIKEGLFSKTIIHPNHIKSINKLYRVTQDEYNEAKEIYSSKTAVFNQNSKMAERFSMLNHSNFILKRAEIYGVSEN